MSSKNAPNPFVPPPLIFVVVFLAGFFLNLVFPLQLLPLGWNRIPAFLLCVGGAGIFLAAVLALRKAKTPVSPYETAQHLQVTGPYLRSRNPIYLAFTWLYLGLTCWIASGWPILLLPALIYGMNRFVIAREEEHLEERFGKTYRDYKTRTRRWV